MRDYFIRRLLLVPPTLLGITIIVFAITRLVPGGPQERAILDAWVALSEIGRGVMAPPGVPEDRRAFLEAALKCALEDPEFLRQAAAAERGVGFLPGAELQAAVRRAVAADPQTLAVLRAALSGG